MVLLSTEAWCIMFFNSSSLRFSPNSLATLLMESKSTYPVPSVSYNSNILFTPSLVLTFPIFSQMASKKVSKSISPSRVVKWLTNSNSTGFLLCISWLFTTFDISSASIDPLPSVSNKLKISLNSWSSYSSIVDDTFSTSSLLLIFF